MNGTAPASQAHQATAGQRGVAGWEFVHVCVDDATRLAYVEVLADEKAITAIGVPAPRASPSTPATASPSSA